MKDFVRPKTQEDLQEREAVGVIRASRFVRKLTRSRTAIDISSIYAIHKEIFKDVRPDIAGELRREDLSIAHSKHRPMHYSRVPAAMIEMNKEFKEILSELKMIPKMVIRGNIKIKNKELKMIQKIVKAAAWIHHKITHIHPFAEGNGRTARLMANLVLERYNLIGISVKMERENKNRYLQALSQIDEVGDYKPLVYLIFEGMTDRYNGVEKFKTK